MFALDHPGRTEQRAGLKARHSAYLDSAPAHGLRVLQSGPWLDEAGQEAGSLLIFEAHSKEAVLAYLAHEPYATNGLFAELRVHPWVWRRGNPYLT